MNLQFQRYIPWFRVHHQNKDITASVISSNTTLSEASSEKKDIARAGFWKWSPFSFNPWGMTMRAGTHKFQLPTTVNKKLKKRSQSLESNQYAAVHFRPYVSKVPWHTGLRGFLSQLFPRYGHYCGPNWSSGKDNGSLVWDKRPIDWLDFCCYCHDIGYDNHDQAELLKADLAFLECLERQHMSTKGNPQVAWLYKFMCTSGLRNILIPYRQNVVKLQTGEIFIRSFRLRNLKLKGWNFAKA